ncbi:DEAD/DEAH box helicase, partial [Acidihalobacter prosperus]
MAELFADLKLSPPLVAAAEELGLTTPREMQSQLVSSILTGQDVMVISSPGSGGTTGYLLGMMQHLLDEPPSEGRGPRALVLAPTRDQAMQVGRMIKQLGRNTRLRFGTVVGGRPYPTQHQLLRRPLDILVATPGRLMDHMHRGRVPFERLRFLLLDKANQMLDMGLGSEIYNIVNNVSDNLDQTVILSDAPNDAVGLLSARLTHNPRKLGYEDDVTGNIGNGESVHASPALMDSGYEDAEEGADPSANFSKAGNKPRNYHARARA